PYIRELITALGMQSYELANYEADDIIGTLAQQVDKKQFDVTIVTGDRDLTQLTTDHVKVAITLKGVSDLEDYTPEHLAQKYDGLRPEQIIDMKGLAGDKSDNIPGVTKIGEKTAIKLLKEYDSVEGIYENIRGMKKSKKKEKRIKEKTNDKLSKKLATINTQAPIEIKVEDLKYEGADLDKLVPFYKEMNFRSFLEKLDIEEKDDIEDIIFEVVKTPSKNMFTDNMALYVEMLGDNYHIEDIVGVAWGNDQKIYVSNSTEVFDSELFKNWLADETKVKQVYNG